MRAKAVIGLGFGDEGKGLVTDYLCSQADKPLVIRFSGGQQAGHTVVNNGVRHVFSNFGAGTLQGAASYFSRFCTIDPIGIVNELDCLLDKGVRPLLFIDAACPVTTPYDVAFNQRHHQHGTCGVGVGDTINREACFYSLTFEDLFYPWVLKTRLQLIQQFYADCGHVELDAFLQCCDLICHCKYVEKSDGIPAWDYSDYIFEGSQGLLLDQHYGFFPYVTRANTGTKNVLSLLGQHDLSFYLVTRAYQTRHGKGVMSNDQLPHNIQANPLETNVPNFYQGEFRRALLDVSLLEYAMRKDALIRASDNRHLVVTCLDHVPGEYRFSYHGELVYCRNETEFIERIATILRVTSVYLSHGDEARQIKAAMLSSH
jgi:adenylosuccinate synthase